MTTNDHRRQPRRRGAALHRVIVEAALAELQEFGYAGFSMERVAERARVSKASLYRRWPSRAELVVDAVGLAVQSGSPPDTGSLRGDLRALLRSAADLLAGPLGEAARGLMAEVVKNTHLAARVRGTEPGMQAMLEVLHRAVARGDLRARAVTPMVAAVGPALLRQHFLMHGAPVPDAVVDEIVDEILLPLLRQRSTPGR